MFENYIRQHWSIESNTHWVLDVVFNQDRLQTVNPEYLLDRTSLTKIGLNTLEKYGKILKDENLSISSMRVMMSNIDKAIDCLEKVYNQKSDFSMRRPCFSFFH